MPFADKFNEAAQNAAIRLIDGDRWQELPWLSKLVQQAVRDSVAGSDVELSTWAGEAGGQIESSLEPLILDGTKFTEEQMEHLLTGGRRCDDFSKKSHPLTVEFGQGPADESHESDKEQPSDSFESSDFSHVEGYDWRIVVVDRLKNHRNSWAEHFGRRPTQEEFEHQFQHFEARTHHVHVNQWVDGDWTTITTDYVPHWSKEKPAETFTTTSDWEEGKNWRIKFWDQRVNRDNFVYFDYKPGGITLQKYHNGKHFAVVEQRPEGI